MFLLTLQIMSHCFSNAIRHPLTPISQYANPTPLELSPIPWWGCLLVLIVGIASWISASLLDINGLPEVGEAMVFMSLTHVFDMSWATAREVKRGRKIKKG
jgi:hypothetical protein